MTVLRFIPALVVIPLLALGCTANAPAPADEAAPAPAPSPLLMQLRADWQAQKETMTAIADAMPEDKFSYRSTPAQRTYGEQIMHVASANVDMLKLLGGKAAAPAFTVESAKTKADILKALADSYDYGLAVLDEQTGATITQDISNAPPWLGPSSRARIVWSLLAHSMDIYGQMAVYLRLNGIVPPASRSGI